LKVREKAGSEVAEEEHVVGRCGEVSGQLHQSLRIVVNRLLGKLDEGAELNIRLIICFDDAVAAFEGAQKIR
jgi:hypothetical protein